MAAGVRSFRDTHEANDDGTFPATTVDAAVRSRAPARQDKADEGLFSLSSFSNPIGFLSEFTEDDFKQRISSTIKKIKAGCLLQGGQKRIGNNRRELSTIDANIVEVVPHPCAAVKKGSEREVLLHKWRQRYIPLRINEDYLLFGMKIVQSNSFACQLEDCIIMDAIDEEDHKATGDHEVPMMWKLKWNTDGSEAVVDIVGVDNKNPLAVTEYIDDIYDYYKKVEEACSVSIQGICGMVKLDGCSVFRCAVEATWKGVRSSSGEGRASFRPAQVISGNKSNWTFCTNQDRLL
ncbi:Unknown protein [Striga hermonthica]|uniref:Uncharacterized protein n=1 Tax=Striga hermonthica TaxID=68872 RepID=A0A9N7N6S8_STRHE|nr:Unknown protein [Striga hermonthica]